MHQQTPTPARWQITEGMTVFSADGHKLGTVRTYAPTAGYLDVKKGFLFTKDFYVPAAAVVSVDGDGIYLNLTRDEVESGRYDVPLQPTEVIHGETFVAKIDVPAEKAPVMDEDKVAEDTYTMHTADGRPIL
jgi:hypothetical protein